MPIESERDGDEIYVKTTSSQGIYEYRFERVDFAWLLVEKIVDGEEEEVNSDTRISQTVRDEVKELNNDLLAMVTTNQFWKKIRDTDFDEVMEKAGIEKEGF